MNIRSLAKRLGLLALSLVWASAAGADTQILKEVPFSDDVRDIIKKECKLQTRLPGFIKSAGAEVTLVDRLSGEGERLELSISEVHAPSGGVFSGPKWIEVTGTLKGAGAPKHFRAKRFSTGGAFGQFKGTCAIIGRATKVVGMDIAAWLREPTDGAELGDAR
jgi:hypothetical protein